MILEDARNLGTQRKGAVADEVGPPGGWPGCTCRQRQLTAVTCSFTAGVTGAAHAVLAFMGRPVPADSCGT